MNNIIDITRTRKVYKDTIEKEWENIKKKIDNKECFT